MATLAAVTHIPALALLAEDGTLERCTEPFRRWYADKEELCRQAAEVKRVLEGQANAAVLKLDGVAVDIAAMADREGGRHVLLTLPTSALPSLGDAGEALLDGALDESPALVWLKDLDGRYVRVNSRFTEFLSTTEERLLGRTDAELPPAETVDGPRAQEREEGVEEPLQLEYVVGAYQGREALVVLRFPVGDRQGVPALVCGVAAPSSEAQVARNEAARLLRVERWSRLDAESVRAELLADWGLLPDARGRIAASPASDPGPASAEHEAAVAEARAERATAVAERDAAFSANEKLASDLEATQARVVELERALESAREGGQQGDAEARLAERAAELDRALARERERADELERTLTLVRQRLGDDAEAARAEVQRARADADAARTELQRARADAEAARTDLERVRAAALEPAQARVEELERELRTTDMRADKAEIELEVAVQRAEHAEAELERGRARVQALEEKLEQDRARAIEFEVQQKLDRARIEELEGERKVHLARIEELEDELERARAKAEEAESAIADLQGRLEAAESQPAAPVVDDAEPNVAEPNVAEPNVAEPNVAEPNVAEPNVAEPNVAEPNVAELTRLETSADEPARAFAGGVSWQPTAKRTLSASLARESVWRNVLKETVEVLGSEGGWDTVTAWLPDDANQLDCAATWTAHRGLERFEALTWEVPVSREGSLLDQALQAPHLTWLTDIDVVDDARLQTAAAHGMSSALLLPVRSGTSTIGLLELLTHDSIEPDAQIALSLEASALQLGRFGHLLSLGKSS